MTKARPVSFLAFFIGLALLVSCSSSPASQSDQQGHAPVPKVADTPPPSNPTPNPPPSPPATSIDQDSSVGKKDPSPPPTTEPLKTDDYYVDTKNFMIHSKNDPNEKIALLTFDDGPKGVVTTQILDILDRYEAKSIWFVSGFNYGWDYKASPQKEAQFISLIEEIHKRGHIVANHTWEHGNLRKQTADKQRKEILSMNELLKGITGEKPQFFRPPFGAYSDVQKQVMKEEGMQTMNWSVGSLDWEYKDPQQIVQQVTSTMHNGANILLHDFPVTAEALDPLLKELTAQGYKFVLPTEVKIE